jgi:hypothetical protein
MHNDDSTSSNKSRHHEVDRLAYISTVVCDVADCEWRKGKSYSGTAAPWKGTLRLTSILKGRSAWGFEPQIPTVSSSALAW